MEVVPLKALMSPCRCCVHPEDPLEGVVSRMVERGASCAVVLEAGKPVGILTERDLTGFLMKVPADPGFLSQPIGAVMISPVITLDLDETLYEAIVVARSERVRHLPIIDNGGDMVGIVTSRDLANAHFHAIEQQNHIIEKAIATRTNELRRINEELQALSMEDHLLEIGNRRAMEVDLEHTHASFQRYRRGYNIALFDIDYFKNYNDFYGHSAGDEALQQVGRYLSRSIREGDRLYRYGGEELLLVMPEIPPAYAHTVAERLVRGLAALQLPHTASPSGCITMSAGTASAGQVEAKLGWQALCEQADQALYKAKSAGRNQAWAELEAA